MKRPLIIGLFVTLLASASCYRNPDSEEQRLSWSTEAPLSIPYHTRQQRFEKKNLVRNPSFETGRILKLNDTQSSFVIDGWQQVGQDVEWVDTRIDSLYRKDEALSGFRAVKITRKIAYETETEGEGIMSDYIKVIPGNYCLSWYMRLENIVPVRRRLGVGMYDAIHVKLLYFDRNKIAINPAKSYPERYQMVDNSNKFLSFANYPNIPNFGWGKIIGKTAEFPFANGDIPTNAHYVKIFIGLKARGIMWIDSVNFSYSRQNFGVQERMASYTDISNRTKPVVIPTPKRMERMESVPYFPADSSFGLPVILLASSGQLVRQAAVMLQQALLKKIPENQRERSIIPILSHATEENLNRHILVFVIGKSDAYVLQQKKFPWGEIGSHPQGYFVYSAPELPHVVFLNGNSETGIYYAALSAIQLIDRHVPVFHNARIWDYPDFSNRFVTLTPLPETAKESLRVLTRELALYKVNGAFFVSDSGLQESALKIPQPVQKDVEYPGIFRLAELSSFMPDKAKSPSQIQVYVPQWLCPDDSTLGYPERINLLTVNQGSRNATSKLFCIPPAFNNQLLNYSQYRDQPDWRMQGCTALYSGSSFFSIQTDDADFDRYMRFVQGKPAFMDNSMLISTALARYGGTYPYYSGKIRLFNLFEPYNNLYIRDHLAQLDTALFWVNYPVRNEIDLIRSATAADFMWNCTDYDPDYSLWKVLVSRYGSKAARIIVSYADQVGLLLEIELKLQKNMQIQRTLKSVAPSLDTLEAISHQLEQLLGPDHPLMQAIYINNNKLKNKLMAYNKIQSEPRRE